MEQKSAKVHGQSSRRAMMESNKAGAPNVKAYKSMHINIDRRKVFVTLSYENES